MLLQQLQAGSEEAFTTLYQHYSPQLYINILAIVKDPLTAEEIVQELFTKIWQKRKNNGLKENFAGYMYRTAQNLVHDFFRKLKRDRQMFERFRVRVEEEYKHTEEVFDYKQSSIVLREALEQLSPQQKKVYELVRERGLTYKKAAEVMGISPLTVKEYLGYTNKTIRRYFLAHTDHVVMILLFSALFLR